MSNQPRRGTRPLDPRVLASPRALPWWVLAALATAASVAALVVAARAFGTALEDAVVRHRLAAASREGVSLAVALLVRVIARRVALVAARAGAERGVSAYEQRLLDAAGARTTPAAALAYLASEGLEHLSDAFATLTPALLEAVIEIPVLLVATARASGILALELVAGLLAMPVLAALIGLATDRRAREQLEASVRLSHLYLDLLGGAGTLAAFGRAREQAGAVDDAARSLERSTMQVLQVAFLSGISLDILAAVVVALVAVSIGIRLNDGSMTLAVGGAVLFWTPEVFAPLRAAALQFHTTADGRAAAAAIDALGIEVSEQPPAPRAPRHASLVTRRQRSSAPLLGLVNLDFVDVPLATPLTLSLERGDHLCVVGRSGVGKSTLLAALAGRGRGGVRGTLWIDGEPHSSLPPEQTVYVPASPAFVAGTVDENLVLVCGSERLDRARALLEALGAEALLARRTAPIGPHAEGLSAGERQRLALARALALERPFIVLDEPTSHLDAASERRLLDLLAAVARASIVVSASHREAVQLAATHVLTLNVLAEEVRR